MTTSRGGRGYLILAGFAWTAVAAGEERGSSSPNAGPSAVEARASSAQESDARAVRRVIRLTDGRTLRGVAQATETGWRSEQGERWIDVPAALVQSVETERAVFAELEALKRKTPASDARARVGLAEWMLDRALVKEAVRELDRVLSVDPDQREALALLRARPIAVALRAAPDRAATAGRVDEIFAAAATCTPALRESCVDRLRAEDAAEVRTRLGRELTSSDAGRRSFATLAWRRLFPGEAVEALQERALLDPQADVRSGAARALRDARRPEVVDRVAQNLSHPAGIVRVHAVQALATMGYGAAVGPLVGMLARAASPSAAGGARPPGSNIFVGTQTAYVQDFDVEVSQNAAIAKPRINVLNEGAVLDVRILSAETVSVAQERAAACTALDALTHARLGKKPAAWIEWWKDPANRARVVAQGAPRVETGASSQ